MQAGGPSVSFKIFQWEYKVNYARKKNKTEANKLEVLINLKVKIKGLDAKKENKIKGSNRRGRP